MLRATVIVVILCQAAGSRNGNGKANGNGNGPASAEAKALTDRAHDDYMVGHFDQALEKYTAAYAKTHAPELLFNIGQCYKHKGERLRAVEFFKKYLATAPEANNAGLVNQMIYELETDIKLDAEAARERAARERERAVERPFPEEDKSLPGLSPAHAAPTAPFYQRPWFWLTIGGSAISVAVLATIAVVFSSPSVRPATQGTVDLR